jgi:hypothetical protein
MQVSCDEVKGVTDKEVRPRLISVLPQSKSPKNFEAKLDWFVELSVHFRRSLKGTTWFEEMKT